MVMLLFCRIDAHSCHRCTPITTLCRFSLSCALWKTRLSPFTLVWRANSPRHVQQPHKTDFACRQKGDFFSRLYECILNDAFTQKTREMASMGWHPASSTSCWWLGGRTKKICVWVREVDLLPCSSVLFGWVPHFSFPPLFNYGRSLLSFRLAKFFSCLILQHHASLNLWFGKAVMAVCLPSLYLSLSDVKRPSWAGAVCTACP